MLLINSDTDKRMLTSPKFGTGPIVSFLATYDFNNTVHLTCLPLQIAMKNLNLAFPFHLLSEPPSVKYDL